MSCSPRPLLPFVVAFLAALAIAVQAPAQPTGNKARVGMLITSNADATRHLRATFTQRLAELGWREGANVEYVVRYAEGKLADFDALAGEMINAKPDLIVVPFGPFAAVVKKHTKDIPIVFSISQDPVGEGLVASLARPAGNATGVSTRSQELVGKRLQLLKETLPRARRIAVVVLETAPPATSGVLLDELQQAADKLGLVLVKVEWHPEKGYGPAFERLAGERVEAVAAVVDWNYLQHADFVRRATQARLPTIGDASEFSEAGGLMSLSVNFAERYRKSAEYVDRILRGAKPAELPVEEPTAFELVINLKTARTLAVTIPSSVLVRVDRAIE